MKTVKSFKHLAKLTKGHQVTAQDLINGETYLTGIGWSKIRLAPDFKESVLQSLSKLYGGHKATQKTIYLNLKHERRQSPGLRRTALFKSSEGDYYLGYMTWQDQAAENRQTRKDLT